MKGWPAVATPTTVEVARQLSATGPVGAESLGLLGEYTEARAQPAAKGATPSGHSKRVRPAVTMTTNPPLAKTTRRYDESAVQNITPLERTAVWIRNPTGGLLQRSSY